MEEMEITNDEQLKATEVNHIRPRKIVSSFKDILKLNEDDLLEVLRECITGLPKPEHEELPVAILSIIGPPSCGKSFLTNLVINYYKSAEDDGGWLEKLTKKSRDGPHRELTGFAWHPITNPPPGIFKPNDEEISTSGVYLWPQLFGRKSNDGKKSMLVLILHLCLGRDKTDDDLQTLERFLIMTSSRMAEIDYGNNDFRILNEVSIINSATKELHASFLKEQHCNSIVYIFSSNGSSSSSKSSADEEAMDELLQIGQHPEGNKIKDPSVLNSFKHVNLARIKHIKGTLEESLLKVEKNMTRSLKKIAEQITDESEVTPKKLKENGATRNLYLKDIAIFFKASADELNAVSSRLRQNKREAIEYLNFQVPSESIPLPLPPSDNLSGDPENMEVEPSLDSSSQTKQDVSPSQNEKQSKYPFQPPKLNVCDFSSIHNQTKEVDIVPKERQQEITPTSSASITPGTTVTITSNDETSAKLKYAVPQETPEEIGSNDRSCPDSPVHLPQEITGIDKPASAPVNHMETKQKKNEIKEQEPTDTKANVKEEAVKQDSDDIYQIINKAVAELKSLLFSATETWLQNHLSQSNISEISKIYSWVFQEITERPHDPLEIISSEKLNRVVDKECRASCEAYLENVESRIKTFNASMKRQFALLDCFSEEELPQAGEAELRKVTSGISPEDEQTLHLVGLGCSVLMRYFRAQNEKIIGHEEALAEQLSTEAKKFYGEEMKRFLLDEIYAPAHLMQIHKELTGKLLSSFRMAFKLISRENICHTVESKLETLKVNLATEFAQHFKENKDKLSKKLVQITAIQRAAESSYKEKIDQVMSRNSTGIQVEELETTHTGIVREAKKLFEMNIRKKTNNLKEPCEVHLTSLEAYVAQHWKHVREINSQNLRRTFDLQKKTEKEVRRQKKEKQREQNEREKENRRLENEKEEEKRKLEIAKEHDQLWAEIQTQNLFAGHQHSGGATSKSTNVDIPQLQPLIFQIQSSRIKMGILANGKPQILPNSFGKESTPFVVGLSSSTQLICGDDVCTTGLSQRPNVKKLWRIMKWFIRSGHEPVTENVQFNDGITHKITVEFLLAFILKNLKKHVEAKMNGEFRTGIITIPFWFTSTQRIQVRNGADLAGFSKVYLINDASAAAYACSSSPSRLSSTNNILVITENDKLLDAFVYSYSIGARDVSMIGHHGSYSHEGWLQYIDKKRCRFQYGPDAEKAKKVRQICDEALAQANIQERRSGRGKVEPNEVFVFAESTEWKPILEQVLRDFDKKVCDIDQENAAIFGAAILSKEPDKIKSIIKDQLAFSISAKHTCEYRTADIFSRSCNLPITTMKMSAKFPVGTVDIFQQGIDKSTAVGWLSMRYRFPKNYRLEVSLIIDNEAVVTKEGVCVVSSGTKESLQDYDWVTPNLPEEEMTRLRHLLNSLSDPKEESDSVSNARLQLQNLCMEMDLQLQNDVVKSEDAKRLIAGLSRDAQNVMENVDSTYEDFQSKIVKLVELQSTFIK